MYGNREPLPVAVDYLADLVKARPTGSVSTRLDWSRIDAEDFERLVFELVRRTVGYENINWLMKTNAADRGRDIEAYRVVRDLLAGVRRYRQALALSREAGNRFEEARALTDLGLTNLRQGRSQEAASDLQRAVDLSREIGERSCEAQALNGLGEAMLATSRTDRAHSHYADALEVASRISERYEQARALDGLGRAYHAAGDQRQARHHWKQALAVYADLGAPETDQLRAQLTVVGGPDHLRVP
jgi:tetratricopeptide (TPR) repeat protein